MSKDKYDLVIFDCDGTLVDSEYLNNKISAEVLNEFGLSGYTTEKCITDFAGKSWGDIRVILGNRHGVEIPDSIIEAYVTRVQAELKIADIAIAGAMDFVSICNDNYKICVGSNGERSNVYTGLQSQGFMTFFNDNNIFTKVQVENPKPAPDLFLLAAERMGADPSRCLVIEDSFSGAKAGVNAGMDVFGFTGVAYDKKIAESQLNEAGVTAIFDDFIHMTATLKL